MPEEKTQNQRGMEIYDLLMEMLGVPELKMENIEHIDREYEGISVIDHEALQERHEAALEEAERIMEMELLSIEFVKKKVCKKKRTKNLVKESEEKVSDVQEAEQELDSLNDA